jgi:hypothetical protein
MCQGYTREETRTATSPSAASIIYQQVCEETQRANNMRRESSFPEVSTPRQRARPAKKSNSWAPSMFA